MGEYDHAVEISFDEGSSFLEPDIMTHSQSGSLEQPVIFLELLCTGRKLSEKEVKNSSSSIQYTRMTSEVGVHCLGLLGDKISSITASYKMPNRSYVFKTEVGTLNYTLINLDQLSTKDPP